MAACISAATPSSFILSSELLPSKGDKPISVSWSSSFQPLKLSIPTTSTITLKKFEDGGNLHANVENNKQDTRFEGKGLVVEAAWTRRSRSEAAKRPNRKSWKQRTDMYMRPFLLNIFFSKRFIHAKVMHRATSKVISVATTNSRDLRNTLPSLTDNSACRVIGKLIAERSKEADVFAMSYEPNKNERIEGRLAIILDTIQENDIIFV